MDSQLPHALGHDLAERERLLDGFNPGANAMRLPPSMRAVTSLERRRHPETQCDTRRIAESPAARPNVALYRSSASMSIGEYGDAALLALRDRPIPLQELLQVRQREQAGQADHRARRRPSADERPQSESRASFGSMRSRSPASR